jgi:hypothetical protein
MNLEDPDSWFDNWHLHFDWKGYGNNSFKQRQPHLDKLFRHFDILQKKTERLKVDFQLYVVLYDYDSYNDALFLNTPNPSTSEFPITLPNLSTASTLTNTKLQQYIEECREYEKLYGIDGQPFCILYKPGIGLPFQPTANSS